jgi:hypothetical protein
VGGVCVGGGLGASVALHLRAVCVCVCVCVYVCVCVCAGRTFSRVIRAERVDDVSTRGPQPGHTETKRAAENGFER